MIDIYSSYIVGVHVHARESGLLAKEMMQQIFGIHGIPKVVHADRGTSMTSKTVAALLGRPGRDPVPLPSQGQQRQPLLRGVVQDLEVRPGLPATIRFARARPGLHGRVRADLQPRAPPQRHRPTHRRRRPLRPRRSQEHRPQSRSWPTPEPLTPSGSPPTPTPRSSPCLQPRGSTDPNPSKHQRLNTHWPQPP